MVGIVIVTHSAKLAEGLLELAEQMTQGRTPIAIAGGIDDPDNPIGTDPMKVMAGIEQVYSEAGVVVLMDLGSAVMSAETALEFLPDEMRPHVHLVAAPLVEGGLAAAVMASTGAPLEQVLAEARAALSAKQAALSPNGVESETTPTVAAVVGPTQTLTLTVPNRLGLHARPAAKLVQTVGGFDAQVQITRADRTINASSMSQVATLGARHGDKLIFTATGPQAEAVLAAIKALANHNFGDDDHQLLPDAAPTSAAAETETDVAAGVRGIPAAPGVALGRTAWLIANDPEITEHTTDDPPAEVTRLQQAIAATVADLDHLISHTRATAGKDAAGIFLAQQLLLKDPTLFAKAEQAITQHLHSAAAAWWAVIQATAAEFKALPDPYQQARAADARDVGRQVLRQLLGGGALPFTLTEPSILLARDLTPSDTVQLDREKVLGIVTELGGATSHSAILARGLGIPAVVGVGPDLQNVPANELAAIDGRAGRLYVQLSEEQQATLTEAATAWQTEQAEQRAAGQQTGQTADGVRIEVAANIGSPADATTAAEYGAEGVGLFRTEFLYMNRPTAPTEDEQYTAYITAAQALAGQPLIIRTLDVGGDKPIAYLDIAPEDNPFLGWRALRYCLTDLPLFKTQLRAICRASAQHPIRLMFPMVSTLNELQQAKAVLREVQTELDKAKIEHTPTMPVGIMVEVPSAVFAAADLAAEVDFFSIGTNDLTQYVMAADRGNAQVAALANALQPAVLRAIAQTAQAATAAKIWIGMCGELAGNPLATPLLVGLGLTELSMSSRAIPAVKQHLRQFTLAQAQSIAAHALQLTTADAVQSYLQSVAEG